MTTTTNAEYLATSNAAGLQLHIATGARRAYTLRMGNTIEEFEACPELGAERELPAYTQSRAAYDCISWAIDTEGDSHATNDRAAMLVKLAAYAARLAWQVLGAEVLAENAAGTLRLNARDRFDELAFSFFTAATNAAYAREMAGESPNAIPTPGNVFDAVA